MRDVVTVGEGLLALVSDRVGPLHLAHRFGVSIAGSECAVAVGLRRLGHTVVWAGRVGADEAGSLIRTVLSGEGVEVSAVTDYEATTGLVLQGRRTADNSHDLRFAEGCAGSRLSPDDLPDDLIESARILHVSTATAAFSKTVAETIEEAVNRAWFVSLDAGCDIGSWSKEEFRSFVLALLPKVQLLFVPVAEARLLTGDVYAEEEPFELAETLAGLGPATVVVMGGRRHAVSVSSEGIHHAAPHPAREIDPRGSSGGFMAGYLSSHLHGADAMTRLRFASQVAAFAVSTDGVWEGLPTFADLNQRTDEPRT